MGRLEMTDVSTFRQEMGTACSLCGIEIQEILGVFVFGGWVICTRYSKNLNAFDYEADERSHEGRLTS